MDKRLRTSTLMFGLVSLAFVSCAKPAAMFPTDDSRASSAQTAAAESDPIVTFIELGSVDCIPCKAMQPVMDEVKKRFGDQVAVLFYDVWTKEGQPYGQAYRIRVIPTQVFLDAQGKEFFRHEGYFAYEDLVKILEQGGVKQ